MAVVVLQVFAQFRTAGCIQFGQFFQQSGIGIQLPRVKNQPRTCLQTNIHFPAIQGNFLLTEDIDGISVAIAIEYAEIVMIQDRTGMILGFG